MTFFDACVQKISGQSCAIRRQLLMRIKCIFTCFVTRPGVKKLFPESILARQPELIDSEIACNTGDGIPVLSAWHFTSMVISSHLHCCATNSYLIDWKNGYLLPIKKIFFPQIICNQNRFFIRIEKQTRMTSNCLITQ